VADVTAASRRAEQQQGDARRWPERRRRYGPRIGETASRPLKPQQQKNVCDARFYIIDLIIIRSFVAFA